ncbi:MAG: hypothetical protein NT068_03250 [Candidatus Nomurabacteria bacterium]|nr:hypothetical protein [Candidatus Nomurabacteria bacterium]
MEPKYGDNSIIISGKYKFTLVKNLPVKYLLDVYDGRISHDKRLTAYVKENIEKIKARLNGKKVVEKNVTRLLIYREKKPDLI